jgi:hypothetical protein
VFGCLCRFRWYGRAARGRPGTWALHCLHGNRLTEGNALGNQSKAAKTTPMGVKNIDLDRKRIPLYYQQLASSS